MSCKPRSSAPVSRRAEKRSSELSTSSALAKVPTDKDGSPRSNLRKVAVEICRRSAMDWVEIRLRRLARAKSPPSCPRARRTGRGSADRFPLTLIYILYQRTNAYICLIITQTQLSPAPSHQPGHLPGPAALDPLQGQRGLECTVGTVLPGHERAGRLLRSTELFGSRLTVWRQLKPDRPLHGVGPPMPQGSRYYAAPPQHTFHSLCQSCYSQ
jgi:hypothetical protein